MCPSKSTVVAEACMLTNCCLAHRDGPHCNSCSAKQCSGGHNCHQWNGSICGHSNLRHNEKHITKKTLTIITSYG